MARVPLVLAIEDNPADAHLIEEALLEADFACTLQVLSDGAKAMQFMDLVDMDARPYPDLVLLDLNLPQISGTKVLERIRQSPKSSLIKVLIVSSSNASVDRERTMALGATGYFRKPSELDEFMQLGPKVRELLQS